MLLDIYYVHRKLRNLSLAPAVFRGTGQSINHEATVHRNTSVKKSQNLRKRCELQALTRRNVRFARKNWSFSRGQLAELKRLTEELRLSIVSGELSSIGGKLYVTHAGLLRIAKRRRCSAIRVRPLREFSDPLSRRWVFKAVVYKSGLSEVFIGYGDADPSNISALVRGAEMRVAETRAVNRALRKAYGIGVCSVEELGWEPRSDTTSSRGKSPSAPSNNGHQNRNPRLRDRLCLLIRQHQLDANLVKAYAADSCGTPNLRDATREQIENFVTNLADWATNDRPALLCKLNSYSRCPEVSL
jgi:hypothetical protein